MKQFVFKLGLFFFIVFMIDVLLGLIFSFMAEHARGGNNGRNNYIINSLTEDVLVFGSSRAMHHYNPAIISDSLGMSCYNCGQDANGIILNYGRYQQICKRYHPKILIYDIYPLFDLLDGNDNLKYLAWLRPYYGREGISDFFSSIDVMENIKMNSQMYRFNSSFIYIIKDYLHPDKINEINGFRPINKEMDTLRTYRKNKCVIAYNYDSLKIMCLKKMIEESAETKIVFVVSPYWDGNDTSMVSPVREMCRQYAIPFIDYSNNPKYIHNNFFFRDGAHLNANGADEFTRDIISEIKRNHISPSIE